MLSCACTEAQFDHVAFLPFTYVAKASGVSLLGSMVMRIGVKFGKVFILSAKQQQKKPDVE